MAYDHGSQSLGIRNPFKLYGFARTVTGTLLTAISGLFLWKSLFLVKEEPISGAVLILFSIFVLVGGIRTMGAGIFQMLRFYVGRSVPISLATNKCRSSQDVAASELKYVQYKEQEIESMLMARKNVTFAEPKGWTSRLIHTLLPKLLFLPIPLRNLAQRFASQIIMSATLIFAFGISWVVVSSGVAGPASGPILSLLSILLLFHLVRSWTKLGKPLSRLSESNMDSIGSSQFIALIVIAIVLPIGSGIALEVVSQNNIGLQDVMGKISGLFSEDLTLFSAWPLLGLLALCVVLTGVPIVLLISERSKIVDPRTEVSEYRDHLQERMHPQQLFINMENVIMANRRYKEMPNRIYRDFNPEIVDQTTEKGSFSGDSIIETQPEFKPADTSGLFRGMRIASLVVSQLMILASGGLLIYLAYQAMDAITLVNDVRNSNAWNANTITQVVNTVVSLLTIAFAWRLIRSFGYTAEYFTKMFFSELRFESLLMFFKCEGTFNAAMVGGGQSIYDSARSDSKEVNSKFTPWIITSRVVTCTFAQEGAQNVEHARHIMEMHSNQQELDGIVDEIKDFFAKGQSLANKINEQDLESMSQLHAINQQMRNAAIPNATPDQQSAAAGGYVRAEQEASEAPKNEE